MNATAREITSRARSRCVAAILVCTSVVLAHGAAEPAPFAYSAEASAVGSCRTGVAGSPAVGSSTGLSTTALGRFPWGGGRFCATAGPQLDRYTFSAGPISQLQDIAAIVGLEYYHDGEKAAAVVAHPGFYFGGRAIVAAADVPIDVVSGIPIAHALNGVLGFSNARFYHHPLPIFGVVWQPSTRVRLQILYPESSVEYHVGPATVIHLGGELVGGGFLVDLPGVRATPVEYSSYRVGLGITRVFSAHCHATLTGGIEVLRNFDAFRASRRDHGSGAPFIALQVASDE